MATSVHRRGFCCEIIHSIVNSFHDHARNVQMGIRQLICKRSEKLRMFFSTMLIDPLIPFFASGVGSPKRRFFCSAHDRTTRLLSKNCWGTRLRPRLQNSRFFSSKSVRKLVKRGVRVLIASLLSLTLRFQPRSRPFVWLLTRTWIHKNTDCFRDSSLTSSPGSSPFSKSPFWKPRSHGNDDVKLTHACHSRKFLNFPDYSLTFTWQM